VGDHIRFDDVEVDYEVVGSGDQVVLAHALPFVGWYAPLTAALTDYTVLHYRRTVPLDGRQFGVDDDANVCARLLRHVGFDRPHVVGHSYGCLVGLALARGGAVTPRSLALLEPATSGLVEPERAVAGMAPLIELYRARGPAVAVEQFLRAVLGDDPRGLLDRYVPGAFDDAVAHADQFFQVELPAAAHWTFGPDDARLVDQPILNVIGTESDPRFAESAAIIAALFPNAVRSVVPGAGHLLIAQEPDAVARQLTEFWHRPSPSRHQDGHDRTSKR
jgi:pimeloyl-ACP methyl ester carboxylesterase